MSIVVPVYNESKILLASLTALWKALPEIGNWETVVVDAGSSDESQTIAETFVRDHATWKFTRASLNSPSVGKTVSAGLACCSGTTALVLPCDCRIETETLLRLWFALKKNPSACGGFRKEYDARTPFLRLYEVLQNEFRTRVLHHLVWTNAMFFPLPREIQGDGFLEDVVLSDELRASDDWQLVAGRVKVSARRYYPRRTIRRVCLNGAVMFLYRLGLTSAPRLRVLYQSLK